MEKAYNPITFVNDQRPALNAKNMNDITQGLGKVDDRVIELNDNTEIDETFIGGFDYESEVGVNVQVEAANQALKNQNSINSNLIDGILKNKHKIADMYDISNYLLNDDNSINTGALMRDENIKEAVKTNSKNIGTLARAHNAINTSLDNKQSVPSKKGIYRWADGVYLPNESNCICSDFKEVTPSYNYTVSFETTVNNLGVLFYDGNKQKISVSSTTNSNNHEFTTPNNCRYILINCEGSSDTSKSFNLKLRSIGQSVVVLNETLLSIENGGKNLWKNYPPRTLVDVYHQPTKMNIKDICPKIEIGKTYTLTIIGNDEANYIYFAGKEEIWYSGTSLQITQAHIDSEVLVYGIPGQSVFVKWQVEEGTVATPYEDYIVSTKELDERIEAQNASFNTLGLQKVEFTTLKNKYIDNTNGSVQNSTGWFATNPIGCGNHKYLYLKNIDNGSPFNVFYDENNAFISSFVADKQYIPIPSNAKYVRLSSATLNEYEIYLLDNILSDLKADLKERPKLAKIMSGGGGVIPDLIAMAGYDWQEPHVLIITAREMSTHKFVSMVVNFHYTQMSNVIQIGNYGLEFQATNYGGTIGLSGATEAELEFSGIVIA